MDCYDVQVKAFVSGQLNEKEKVRAVYDRLAEQGIKITHDWTKTDKLTSYSLQQSDAAHRALLDIRGVLTCDYYVLMTDNRLQGKGMYAELGAALALAESRGTPEVFVVGPKNHESIFYYHPLINHCDDLEECIEMIQIKAQRSRIRLSPAG